MLTKRALLAAAAAAAAFAVPAHAGAASRSSAKTTLKVWGDPHLTAVECEDYAWSRTGSRTAPTDRGPGALTITMRRGADSAAIERLQRGRTVLPKMELAVGGAPVALYEVTVKNKSAFKSSTGSEAASGRDVALEQVTLAYERIEFD